MPRRVDSWDHWYHDRGVTPGRQNKTYTCKYCLKSIAYRAARLFRHLGYEGGNTNDIAICMRVPPLIRQQFAESGGIEIHVLVGEPLPEHQNEPQSQEDDFEPILSQSVNQSEDTRRETISGLQGNPQHAPRTMETPPRELRQLSLNQGFNNSTRLDLDKAWVAVLYETNIPFNVIRHPTFIHAVRETAKSKMPAYRPPALNAIRTSLLTAKKVEVEKEVKNRLGDSIQKYGVMLCNNGWDNVQNRPLLNVVQSGTRGDLFLGTIDTTGESKDADYIAEQLKNFMTKVGSENVVQICTDNAAAMVNAARNVMDGSSHMYIQGCAAHCLDLLLEDWGKQAWITRLSKKARKICTFTKNHHATQALFRRLSPDLTLHTPVETRFATNFLMIDRLRELRPAIEKMLVEDEWYDFLGSLRRQGQDKYLKGMHVRSIIRSDAFWDSCENFIYMVVPILKVLRVFDGKAPAMGLAWRMMYDLQKHVENFSKAPMRMDVNMAEQCLKDFKARWEMMKTDLHWAGAMLNPLLRGWIPLHEHESSRAILNRVLQRLTKDHDTYLPVLTDYQDFLENRGPFEGSTNPSVHDAPFHEW
jgi:hypothetical protein